MLSGLGPHVARRLHDGLGRVAPDPARRLLDGMRASLLGSPHRIRHLDLARALARRRRQPDQPLVGWILYSAPCAISSASRTS